MRSNFTREPIRQLLETIVDNRGMTVPAAEDGIPLIATNCIKETSLYPTFENIRYVSKETHRTWFRSHLQPEDILFVNKGTPGRVCMVPDPVSFCAAQDMIGLRADRSKVYPRYLFAFLRSDWVKEKIGNYHVGLAIPHFKKQDLDCITVPRRSDAEQKAIGDLYFLLSEKIELNHRINAELEGMAKLLYDYWFVQFDFPMTAVQAAAMGKPHLTGHPYRASGGPMIYNETLKRNIPKLWTVQTLSQCIARIIDHRGKTPNKLGGDWSTQDDAIIALSARVVKGGKLIGIERANKVDRELYEKWMPTKLMDGDILMTSEAPAGEFYFIHGKTEYCLSQRLFAIRADQTKVLPAYLYHELSGGHAYSEIMGSLSGSTVFGIRQDVLRMIKVVIPDMPLLQKFEDAAIPLLRSIKVHDEQNQELTQLRDWLLPMLMNGQVTVG